MKPNKVLIINAFCGKGSTGKIAENQARHWISQGAEACIAYGRDKVGCDDIQTYCIGSSFDYKLHGVQTRLFDTHALNSKKATQKFIKWVEKYNPDLIHLHNLHGYYLNIEILFDYIKRENKKIFWTLHDCWPFTGHCPYFDFVGCDKWKTTCYNCPQKKEYPASKFFDNSKNNYKRKKNAFTNVKDLTIITPSNWLANLVKQSYLKEYPIEVIYNTVDTEIFKPRESDFRKKYNLEDKKIILGVASIWEKRKGLDDFYKLAKTLDESYKIVLVGLNEKQIKEKPKNILGIKRTNNAIELAEIYSAADVFFNASVEETFGLTSVEAIACGTKTIVYKGTACEEIVGTKNSVERDILKVEYRIKELVVI